MDNQDLLLLLREKVEDAIKVLGLVDERYPKKGIRAGHYFYSCSNHLSGAANDVEGMYNWMKEG